MAHITYYDSPPGRLLVELEGDALTGLWFIGQRHFPERYLPLPQDMGESPAARGVKLWLDAYFRGEQPEISRLSLKPAGSMFRQRVWEELCKIPYGESISYGELARSLEEKHSGRCSARAVGGAVGHNPISVIIPCHRVLGAAKRLTGYAGGLERKIYLLELEKIRYRT